MQRRNHHHKHGYTMVIKRSLIVFVLLAISTTAHAQRFNTNQFNNSSRDGQWEGAVVIGYENGSDLTGENGSSIDIDSAMNWGFSLGYNLTSKWNFNFRFAMSRPDYSARIVPEDPENLPQTINFEMSKYSSQFNAVYNFFEGPLTPYVQAGLGWSRLDSNILDRPPSTGCWWDPWWGYICHTTWSTYDTNEFSYNLGLGLRWDVNEAVFSRASYTREFIDVDSGSLDFDTLTLEIGIMW